jgi:proline iminopeptidase
MAFRKLYLDIRPFSTGYLKVDDIHTLYWEQCGNPDGVPVIVLHGGPGQGANPMLRRFFDPDFYRIILFDQRGCGRSEPLAELENNTPDHLVSDIVALRNHLKISKWHVFGGSWGAVLALLYAAREPQICISLMIRSISMFTKADCDWFLYGMRKIFPEVWARFARDHNEADILSSYYEALQNDTRRLQAGEQWVDYEGSCSTLYPQFRTVTADSEKQAVWVMALIEAHYFKNHLFKNDKYITDLIDKFRTVPGVLIHGRYDMITPLENAYKLHKAWPESDLIIVPDGGHSALDPAIQDRILMATDNARSIR